MTVRVDSQADSILGDRGLGIAACGLPPAMDAVHGASSRVCADTDPPAGHAARNIGARASSTLLLWDS
jgi:hypothetical protein